MSLSDTANCCTSCSVSSNMFEQDCNVCGDATTAVADALSTIGETTILTDPSSTTTTSDPSLAGESSPQHVAAVHIHTLEELKTNHGTADVIVIHGELACHVRRGRSFWSMMRTMGITSLTLGGLFMLGTPYLWPVAAASSSLLTTMMAPVMGMSGLSYALIMSVMFVGSTLLLAVWDQYDEVSFEMDVQHQVYRLVLKRK